MNLEPENVYVGEALSYPGVWALQLPSSVIILVSDEELRQLSSDPDAVLNLTLGFEAQHQSLRQVCEQAQAKGMQTLIVSFDHFFAQYRPGINHARALTPDMDEYVEHIARIGRFAAGYGLKLELSLLSPLEIGTAYARQTGESGRWLQYRKGLRDPTTGAFSVSFWQHRRWVNNKGPIDLEPNGVRVFAFSEEIVPGTSCRAVKPNEMIEISELARLEVFEGINSSHVARRVQVSGRGRTNIGDLNRVLVVQQYRVLEMDYFSPSAAPYLRELLDKYLKAGVQLSGFYSDEMHIQQDWDYFNHHEHGQFTLRYVSPGLERQFAARYGAQYADLARYMIYFAYGQEDFASDMSALQAVQHVFGSSPDEIHQTALFRSRYFEMLQNGVVDLFLEARRYAESQVGHKLYTRAHATWAESPTIDHWRSGSGNEYSLKYEYGSHFVWSNTVHQAASACHDYFKWGEYLTGSGTDHPECGWLDRNYHGAALACSIGILNEVPYAYCAHWGMPPEIAWRRQQINNAYGASHEFNIFGVVQELQHREIEVLMLYPLDLVSAEERFGSWMTQYGYANTISAAKLLELAVVKNGALELAGRSFTTLIASFEPFPSIALLELMEQFAASGGRVIWSAVPPRLDREGQPILERFSSLFGISVLPSQDGWGQFAPGRQINFEADLEPVSSQTVLTDFLVDHLHPVIPQAGTRVVARSGKFVVGTLRPHGKGVLVFLGYRPRDDQSQSMGFETRNWFEVLNALGAYAGADNPTVVSRTSEMLACRFPNGTITLAPHLTTLEEDWYGGFSRKIEDDLETLKRLELPTDRLNLESFALAGHRLEYQGRGAMAFRLGETGNLIAFAGHDCSSLTVDGRRFEFADRIVGQVGWAAVSEARQLERGARLIVWCDMAATLKIPAHESAMAMQFFAEAAKPGSLGTSVTSRFEHGHWLLEITAESAGRWIYGVPVSTGVGQA
jgi:hypothetical protein